MARRRGAVHAWGGRVGRRLRAAALAWMYISVLAVPGVLLATTPAMAATGTRIQVPADCPVNPANPGQSLVNALQAAQDGNASGECANLRSGLSGPYTIILDPSQTYTLSTVNNYSDGPEGLPAIIDQVTVESSSTTVDAVVYRGPGTPDFRFFDVAAPTSPLCSGTTYADANSVQCPQYQVQSLSIAALVPSPGGNLTLQNIELQNGVAQGGGGADCGGGGAGLGGAIFSHGGDVTLIDSVLTGNSAAGGAGAAYTLTDRCGGGGGGMGGAGGAGGSIAFVGGGGYLGAGGGGGGLGGNGGAGAAGSSSATGGGGGGGGGANGRAGTGSGGGSGGVPGGAAGGFGSGAGGVGAYGGGGGGGGGGGSGGFGGGGGNGGFGGGGGGRAGVGGGGTSVFGGGGGSANGGGGGGGAGMGGAIFVLGGNLSLTDDVFASNAATGGSASSGGGPSPASSGSGYGGAIFVDATNNGTTGYSTSGTMFSVSSPNTASTSKPDVYSYGTTSAAPLAVYTPSLPDGTLGTAYSQALTATGGTAPYTWQASGLPTGLSLTVSGSTYAITGRPTEVGTFSVKLTVADSNAVTAAQTLPLSVLAADGSGSATVSQTDVTAGSTGDALTFTYTAATGGTVDGSVYLTVPAGWTAPQTASSGSAGYVSASGGSGTDAVSVTGGGPWTLAVSGATLNSGQTLTIAYGGVNAPTTAGDVTFPVSEASTASGTPVALANPPTVTVVAGGGGGGATLVPTVTGISPSDGPAGTTATISGSGFAYATTVDFGSVPAQSFNVDSGSQVTAVAPPGSGTVDVTVSNDVETSATNPADQFTYATPTPKPPSTVTFSDVPAGLWAYPYIEQLAGKGIVNGFPDGTFRPDAAVTRAQFVKMLVLTLGLKPSSAPRPFSDVAASARYAPYVSAAVQAGIVKGTSATTFSPERAVTREQVAVLVARALKLSKTAALHFSDDATIGAWALQGVEEAVAAGYIDGFPNGTFQPLGAATRAQAAKVLAVVLQQMGS